MTTRQTISDALSISRRAISSNHVTSRGLSSKKGLSLQKGFTLIELLMVSAVIVIVSALVFANNNRFGGRVLLQNFSYDLALTIRKAQVYGISVNRFSANTFNAGYGVHFDITTAAGATNYILYGDGVTTNGLYDTGELVESYSITRGYKIIDICTWTGNTQTCGLKKLDILFLRPEPDAQISAADASCALSLPSRSNCKTRASIIVGSPRGDSMSVVIDESGQLSVQ